MTRYTIFGFYSDNGLLFSGVYDAVSPDAAIQLLADLHPDQSISITAVVRGEHHSEMEGDYLSDTDDYKGVKP